MVAWWHLGIGRILPAYSSKWLGKIDAIQAKLSIHTLLNAPSMNPMNPRSSRSSGKVIAVPAENLVKAVLVIDWLTD